MFQRLISQKLNTTAEKYRAIGLVGPRQSGKTTLAKNCFPDHSYVSLENPDIRARATEDPRLFLKSCRQSTILDEVQNVPELFSYLQEILDDKKDGRQFVLTGSNSFQLNEKIAQSLAGRIRIFHVLPLVYEELPEGAWSKDLDLLLHRGYYPRVYDEQLEPYEWFLSYYQTYLQKDIKTLVNVSDTNQFDRFVRLSAGRVGQLGDYSSIAHEIGVSQPTATRWSSVLESSFITFRLHPFFKSYNKRIIKSPKLYFYDTGLLCQLLKIKSADDLTYHPMRGAIFENFVVSEWMKIAANLGVEPSLYYWRDQHGHEIDMLYENGRNIHCFEVKSGSTFHSDWLKHLLWFSKLEEIRPYLIFGGEQEFLHKQVQVFPWLNFDSYCQKLLE